MVQDPYRLDCAVSHSIAILFQINGTMNTESVLFCCFVLFFIVPSSHMSATTLWDHKLHWKYFSEKSSYVYISLFFTITEKTFFSPPQQYYKPKLTTTTQPTTVQTTIQLAYTVNEIIIIIIVNTISSSTLIHKILRFSQNSVYPTIFTLIHKLTIYTTLCTKHLKTDRNTFNMAKSPTKCLESQLNQKASIHCHVKVKRPRKLQQQ